RRVFSNTTRTPSVSQLRPPGESAPYANPPPPAPSGPAPPPRRGPPSAIFTDLWMSPLGVPCAQPPFGTVGALDLRTRTIAWQVPAGTAEQLGPLGVPLGLPMPIGAPAFAGASATAGGRGFLPGAQGFFIPP